MSTSVPMDHIVIGGPDLDELGAWWQSTTGTTPIPGGSHAGRGTANLLVGAGPTTYVELIGPDKGQADPQGERPFGLDDLNEISLITFALAVDDIEVATRKVASAGVAPGPIESMSRARPDGTTLRWRVAFPPEQDLEGVMPFLIEWGTDTVHPASHLAVQCQIVRLSQAHPRAEDIEAAQKAVAAWPGLVNRGEPRLSVSLETPKGMIDL